MSEHDAEVQRLVDEWWDAHEKWRRAATGALKDLKRSILEELARPKNPTVRILIEGGPVLWSREPRAKKEDPEPQR